MYCAHMHIYIAHMRIIMHGLIIALAHVFIVYVIFVTFIARSTIIRCTALYTDFAVALCTCTNLLLFIHF